MNLIQIFNEIRDIPYKIPLSANEEDNCCSGKSIRLKKILEGLGYKVNYRVCDFLRSDLKLPSEVINVKHENNSTHVYLEVLINNEVIVVDPTRDENLKSVFPVNIWNGVSNTYFAVKPIKLYSLSESKNIMETENKHEIEKDLEKNGEFYSKFNNRLEEIRKSE